MAFKYIKGCSTLLTMRKIQVKNHSDMPVSYPIRLAKIQTFDLNSIRSLRLREPDTGIYCCWGRKQVQPLQGGLGHYQNFKCSYLWPCSSTPKTSSNRFICTSVKWIHWKDTPLTLSVTAGNHRTQWVLGNEFRSQGWSVIMNLF